MNIIIGGEPLFEWGIAVGLFVLAFVLLTLARRLLVGRLKIWASRTETDIDDFVVGLLEKTKTLYLGVTSLVLALHYLQIGKTYHAPLKSVFILATLVQVAFWGEDTIDFLIARFILKRKERNGNLDASFQTTLSAIKFLSRLALYILILLLILDNLGFNVTALLAGLGVGGIAVALAAQNILGDLFSSLSIVLDKPFVIGDYIEVGDKKGTVEKIGLKTTRLTSVTGEQLIISNTDLLSSRIHNFQRMKERRVSFTLGVTYQTPTHKLQIIPSMVKNIIEGQKMTRFDRAHLKTFGDSALVYEVIYWVKTGNVRDYVEVEEQINLEILKSFERENIEFAYPTRTLYMERLNS